MQQYLFGIILLLGIATYSSAVYQMLSHHYSPSFFSRGVWLLIGINSFAGVYLGGGSQSAVLLAGILLAGNLAVFMVSYFKGSREFGTTEKISLCLFFLSCLAWLTLDAPLINLCISLVAHFIGGIPTIARTIKRPESERAIHWSLFFTASVISIIAATDRSFSSILFPAYFCFFNGTIILLAYRHHIDKAHRSLLGRRVKPDLPI